MIVCIHDANILIDLFGSELLDAYARLGWETHVPDLVLREVRQDLRAWIRSGTFRIRSFDAAAIGEILALQAEHSRRLSLQDTSALFLARTMNVPLMTGDGTLRKAAEKEKIECRGLLWILDKLLEAGESPGYLAERLEVALAQGARLPEEECERRLVKWRASTAGTSRSS
ncbi:MAG TPA: type II toxin-antitoxin system VapC family toxin [Fibrobacteria bacterium]|nr:type II toxin-antitoxin system VapC family toxin [Fibrobacteria bacterium]